MVVDRLVKAHAPGAPRKGSFNAECVDAVIGGEKCLFLKPTTYMNRSGQSVSDAVRFYKINPATDLLVVVDDIYLDVGAVRLRPSGGAGGHNGLTDVEQKLGGPDYPRLRVGVGAKPPFMDQADWVLSRFREEEWPVLEKAVETAAKAAEEFARSGLNAAMNKFNAPDAPPRPKKPAPADAPPRTQAQPPNAQNQEEGKTP
jgi:PTH1 family peptidyl-tRNA hydrolase